MGAIIDKFAKFFRLNITMKFSIAMSVLVIGTAVIFSWLFIAQQKGFIRRELKDRGTELTENLAYNTEYGVLTENKELLLNFAKGSLKNRDVVYCIIQNKEGEVLAHADILGRERDYRDAGFKGDGLDAQETFKSALNSQGSVVNLGYLYVGKSENTVGKIFEGYNIATPIKTKRIVQRGEEIAISPEELPSMEEVIGVAQVGLSLESSNVLINSLTQVVLIITLFIILAGIGASLILTRIIVKPIKELAVGTHKVATGDLTYHVDIDTGDELGELASSFNQMTDDLALFRDRIEQRRRELEEKNRELEQAYDNLKRTTEELRLAQSQLVQSEKMTAIGQLGAGVAHELNNPMGGILGYAQFMLEKIDRPEFSKEDFQVCKKYLQHIEREAARCKTIVENLLTFSRKREDISTIDIRTVIDKTLSIISHQLALANIKLTVAIEADIAKIRGNVNMLQQVFVNLIINAQHAMAQGGELAITAKNMRDAKGRINKIEIEVKDTGCGIPKENLTKIFDPFFTTKQDWKGTGLGLFITYKIIKDHQGDITVESEVGKGTAFVISLPVYEERDVHLKEVI